MDNFVLCWPIGYLVRDDGEFLLVCNKGDVAVELKDITDSVKEVYQLWVDNFWLAVRTVFGVLLYLCFVVTLVITPIIITLNLGLKDWQAFAVLGVGTGIAVLFIIFVTYIIDSMNKKNVH